MDDDLRAKLSRINVDNRDRYYYSGMHDFWSLEECAEESYADNYYYRGDGDDVADADIEEHEKILDIKSMRRYLS
jgi:hypothetical protein